MATEEDKSFSTKESIDQLCSDFGRAFNQEKYSDVTLRALEYAFHGHRVILGNRCKFFDEIFQKEEQKEIDLMKYLESDTFDVSSLEILFSYLYDGKLSISSSNVLDVYGLCTKMNLESAVTVCEKFINKLIGSGLVCRLLLHAKKRNKQQLIDTTMRAIENNTEDAMDNEEFLELPEDFIIELLKNEKLTCTEKGLFEGVLRWWCANKDDLHPGSKEEQDGYLMKSLLYYIRFPLMTPEELTEIEKMKLLPPNFILDAFRHHACGSFDAPSLEDEVEDDEEEVEEVEKDEEEEEETEGENIEKKKKKKIVVVKKKKRKKEVKDIYKDESFRTKLRGESLGFVFDESQIGKNIVISKDGLVCEITKSGVQQYQMVLAGKIFEHGLQFWELEITEATNTSHIMIGVTQPGCKLNDWLGHDQSGWSWFGYNGTKYNKGRSPAYASNTKFRKGDVVGVKLDLRKDGVLSFYLNGKPLGYAFNTLKNDSKIKKYIPALSLRSTGEKVTLRSRNLKYRAEYRKFLGYKDK